MRDKEGYTILSITKTLIFYAIIMTIIFIANQAIFQIAPLSQNYTFALAILLDLLIFFIAIEIVINNFSINRSINTLLHSYLVAAIATIIIVIAFGLFLFIVHEYVYPSPSNQVLTSLVQGSSSDMKDETLLGVLAILISFTGLLAAVLSYAFNRIIKKELHEDIRGEVGKLFSNERNASKAENYTAIAYLSEKIYQQDSEKFPDFLESSIHFNEQAHAKIDGLSEQEYGDVIFRVKNNLMCNLATRQKERNDNGSEATKEMDPLKREKALSLVDEVWKLIESGRVSSYTPEPYRWEETCAWVIYCFAENNKEEARAMQIMANIKNHYPQISDNWYQKNIDKYDSPRYPVCETSK